MYEDFPEGRPNGQTHEALDAGLRIAKATDHRDFDDWAADESFCQRFLTDRPREWRTAIQRYWRERCTRRELANELGLPLETVKNLLRRIRKAAKDCQIGKRRQTLQRKARTSARTWPPSENRARYLRLAHHPNPSPYFFGWTGFAVLSQEQNAVRPNSKDDSKTRHTAIHSFETERHVAHRFIRIPEWPRRLESRAGAARCTNSFRHCESDRDHAHEGRPP